MFLQGPEGIPIKINKCTGIAFPPKEMYKFHVFSTDPVYLVYAYSVLGNVTLNTDPTPTREVT